MYKHSILRANRKMKLAWIIVCTEKWKTNLIKIVLLLKAAE